MKKFFLLVLLLNTIFAQSPLSNAPKLIVLFSIFILIFVFFYFILKKFINDNKISLVSSLSISLIFIYIIMNSPFGKLFVSFLLPFILFSVFLLVLIFIFFSSLGVKFGQKEDENNFINVVSNIIMWTSVGLFLIIFIAALKKMGINLVNKILNPSILGILVFLLILGFIVMELEKE